MSASFKGGSMKIKVTITRQENADYFNTNINDIVDVDFEEYVAAVVASEIGNSNLEACKAQAIAARTFAVSRGVLRGKAISDSSSVAQAYRAKRYNKDIYPNPILAAKATSGYVLMYNNKPITAVYSSCNGCRTISSQEHWGNISPYLISQYDPWDSATGRKKNGHGVGMSQVGAIWAGNHNILYDEILAFYYPNTEIYCNYGEAPIKKFSVPLEEIKNLKEKLYNIKRQLEGKL